ncbi:unnamed protein product, partial [Thlaspi arvense]
VIGQVVNVKDLEGVQLNGKERKKIEFELRDTNKNMLKNYLAVVKMLMVNPLYALYDLLKSEPTEV